MRVTGRVRFDTDSRRVYEHIARSVLEHAVDAEMEASSIDEETTLLTRYDTKRWYGTITTTEEATLVPGTSITWRHVDGPLTGSVESFRFSSPPSGGAMVVYRGDIVARHPLLKGPAEWLFVAPEVRRVSLGFLRQVREELVAG